MMKIGKKRYLLCFAFLCILCYLFPYTGDDWAWGSSIGIDRLRTWFDNYSGRYFGNLIVLALTRSHVLNVLVKAFCLTGIVFCLERLVNKKYTFYIACFLLLCLPRLVLRQSIVWTAGFANYATSAFLTLIYIVYIYAIFENGEIKKKNRYAPLLLILGIANTLIVEHLTVYNVMLAVFVLVFTFIKYRKIVITQVCYFAGTVLGTCYMFSNSVYHSIQENADGYRSVASGGIIQQVLNSYFNTIYEELFMNNICLNFLLLGVCVIVYYDMHKNCNVQMSKILRICLGIFGVYMGYSVLSAVYLGETAKQPVLMYVEGLATIVCCCAIILFSILVGIYYKKLEKILFVVGSIICVAAPLFVVNPIGSRCFFPTYCLFILLICELYNVLPEKVISETATPLLRRVCIFACCGSMLFYICIFMSIYRVDKDRLEHIRNQISVGEKQIEILHLPYETYLWAPTPGNSTIWEQRYKLFYDIPEDVQLQAVWSYSK